MRISILQSQEFRAAGCRTLGEGERYLQFKSPPAQLDSSLLSQGGGISQRKGHSLSGDYWLRLSMIFYC